MVTRSSERWSLPPGWVHPAVKSDARAARKRFSSRPARVDVAIETAGTPQTLETAVGMLKKGGTPWPTGCALTIYRHRSPLRRHLPELSIGDRGSAHRIRFGKPFASWSAGSST